MAKSTNGRKRQNNDAKPKLRKPIFKIFEPKIENYVVQIKLKFQNSDLKIKCFMEQKRQKLTTSKSTKFCDSLKNCQNRLKFQKYIFNDV